MHGCEPGGTGLRPDLTKHMRIQFKVDIVHVEQRDNKGNV
jgi:hypothetical protein